MSGRDTENKKKKGSGKLNKNKLESQMKLFGDTAGDLAKFIGITRTTFSYKINEKNTEFTQSEIAKIKEKYNLSARQVDDIFFG